MEFNISTACLSAGAHGECHSCRLPVNQLAKTARKAESQRASEQQLQLLQVTDCRRQWGKGDDKLSAQLTFAIYHMKDVAVLGSQIHTRA